MKTQIKTNPKSNEINAKRLFILYMQKMKAYEIYEQIVIQFDEVFTQTKEANELFMHQGSLYRLIKAKGTNNFQVTKLAEAIETIQNVYDTSQV